MVCYGCSIYRLEGIMSCCDVILCLGLQIHVCKFVGIYSRLWLYICFVFSKKKTAYEMRISDWSSDVCSSDLLATKPRQYRLASLPALDLRRRFLDKPQRVQLRRVALQLQALLAHTLREVSPARVGNPELDGPKPRRTHPLAVPIYLVSPLLDR